MKSDDVVATLDTATRGHHPDSPSSLQSSMACPHFKNRNTNSAASIAGTLQHKASETRDLSILEEPEHIEAVQRTIDLEDLWIEKMKAAGAVSVEVVREKYLAVCPEHTVVDEAGQTWKGITGGFPDTLIVATFEDGTQLINVLDWKFGQMLVTPTKDNLQGISYGLAALQEWPKAAEVLVQFYHPHIEFDEHRSEYTHTFARADMDEMELSIRIAVARKHRAKREGWNGDIKPTPCTNLCVWCDHMDKAECPAVLTLAVQTHDKHERLAVPSEVRPSYLSDPIAAKEVFKMTKVLEAFSKAARRRITDMVITEGLQLPGFTVVTKADRTIKSLSAVRDTALEMGVTQEEFEECLSLPITTLEDLIKSKAPKGKGAAAIRAFKSALEDCGAMETGKPYSYLKESKEDEAIDV